MEKFLIMADWNNLTAEQRYHEWANFRKSIQGLEKTEAIDKVAKYWANAPIGTRSLDFYDSDSWPTPWEILNQGSFCENSISLLIYYTIKLSDFETNIRIILIDDGSDRLIVPIVEDKYVLNYELGEISIWHNIRDTVKVIDRFFDNDIRQVS